MICVTSTAVRIIPVGFGYDGLMETTEPKNKGGRPRVEGPCGSYPAAKRHERRGELPLDDACAQASRDYHAGRRAAIKAKAAK